MILLVVDGSFNVVAHFSLQRFGILGKSNTEPAWHHPSP